MTRSDLRRIRAERRVRRSRPALYATGLLTLGAWFGYKLRSRAENGARRIVSDAWAKYARSRGSGRSTEPREREPLFIGSSVPPDAPHAIPRF